MKYLNIKNFLWSLIKFTESNTNNLIFFLYSIIVRLPLSHYFHGFHALISFLNDQAVATQKDLELNLELTSSLKKEKASLLSELKIMKKSLQESADEKTELTNVLATKSVQWGEVQNLVNTHVREKEELKKVLEAAKTESKNFKLQLKSAVEGALVTEATLKDLEDDLDTRREQSIILQEELLKQSVRSISSVLCCVVSALCFLFSLL